MTISYKIRDGSTTERVSGLLSCAYATSAACLLLDEICFTKVEYWRCFVNACLFDHLKKKSSKFTPMHQVAPQLFLVYPTRDF